MKLFEVITKEKYKSVIITSLGTGHYGYTHQEVAELVAKLLKDFCSNNETKVLFNLLNEDVKKIYEPYFK